MAKSIDNVVNDHSDDDRFAECAKIAIAEAILKCERESPLVPKDTNPNFDSNSLNKTWYFNLFKLISGSIDEIKSNLQKIAFVVFNYDRCLETLLLEFVRNYQFEDSEPVNIVNRTEIYHPYGQVGRLNWQTGTQLNNDSPVINLIQYQTI